MNRESPTICIIFTFIQLKREVDFPKKKKAFLSISETLANSFFEEYTSRIIIRDVYNKVYNVNYIISKSIRQKRFKEKINLETEINGGM